MNLALILLKTEPAHPLFDAVQCFRNRNYLEPLLPSPRFNKGIRVNL